MAEKKVFDVHVEQGHMHNAKVVLRGEAGLGSDPTILPGDVVFVLEMRPHAVFKRVHHDLIMEKVRCASLHIVRGSRTEPHYQGPEKAALPSCRARWSLCWRCSCTVFQHLRHIFTMDTVLDTVHLRCQCSARGSAHT